MTTQAQYCTLANVRDALKINAGVLTEDNYITNAISAASFWIEEWCGRTFGFEAAGTRLYNGTGTKRLPLVEDIVNLTSIGVMYFENDPSGYQSVPCQSVNTTATQTVNPGTATVTPVSMTGIVLNSRLYVDTAGKQETVAVTAVTGTTFTGVFNNQHTGTWAITANPDIFTEPQNTLQPGWPFQWLDFGVLPQTSVGAFYRGHRTVRVVGDWGWSTIPSNVTQACLDITMAMHKRRLSGFADSLGPQNYGGNLIGKFVPQWVYGMLAPYQRIRVGSSHEVYAGAPY